MTAAESFSVAYDIGKLTSGVIAGVWILSNICSALCHLLSVHRDSEVDRNPAKLPPRLNATSRVVAFYIWYVWAVLKEMKAWIDRLVSGAGDQPKEQPGYCVRDDEGFKAAVNSKVREQRFRARLIEYDRFLSSRAGRGNPNDEAVEMLIARNVKSYQIIAPRIPLTLGGIATRLEGPNGPVIIALESALNTMLARALGVQSQALQHELIHIVQDARLGTFASDWHGDLSLPDIWWYEFGAWWYGCRMFTFLLAIAAFPIVLFLHFLLLGLMLLLNGT
ncbi:MAG: hypothetical protein ACKV0T_01745 [Planctomycetales bacterium]